MNARSGAWHHSRPTHTCFDPSNRDRDLLHILGSHSDLLSLFQVSNPSIITSKRPGRKAMSMSWSLPLLPSLSSGTGSYRLHKV